MTDYERLKIIYDKIDHLIVSRVDFESPAFVGWYNEAKEFLEGKYGDSVEYRKFLNTKFTMSWDTSPAEHYALVVACNIGLQETKKFF